MVRDLAKILVGGFVVFMTAAMIQERQTFLAVIGNHETAPADDRTEIDPQVEDTIRRYLSLAGHLYASGGDARFAERLPASEDVVQEILSDITYLRHNRRVQEMSLMGLVVKEVQRVSEDMQRASCVEYWVIRTLWGPDRIEADPPRSEVHTVDYLLEREGSQWLVRGWELAVSSTVGTEERVSLSENSQ